MSESVFVPLALFAVIYSTGPMSSPWSQGRLRHGRTACRPHVPLQDAWCRGLYDLLARVAVRLFKSEAGGRARIREPRQGLSVRAICRSQADSPAATATRGDCQPGAVNGGLSVESVLPLLPESGSVSARTRVYHLSRMRPRAHCGPVQGRFSCVAATSPRSRRGR